MEVHMTGIGLPAAHEAADRGIVEGLADAQPAAELVASADIVSREDVQPSEAPEHDVLRGPSADAVERPQARRQRGVVLLA